MGFNKTILILFYLSCLAEAAAQDKPVAEVSVEKNRVLLGETFRFRLQVQFPQGSTGQFPVIDSIPHFEFAGKPVIDSSDEKGARNIKAVYQLTSFDSGHWVIPSFYINPSLKTDTIGIDVVFSEFNPEQPYHDIKDIIEVKAKSKNHWWWYAAGGALLLVIATVYFLSRKKPVVVVKPAAAADPYTEAMKQLQELQQSRPESKYYHSKLTDIFRLYIFRKKGILSLQKTTDDLVLQLKGLNLEKTQFEKLSQALRLSDFVKFAKYNPSDGDNDVCFNTISESVKLIEQSGS